MTKHRKFSCTISALCTATSTPVILGQLPELVQVDLTGSLDDNSSSTGFLNNINGTTLDWSISALFVWSEPLARYEVDFASGTSTISGLYVSNSSLIPLAPAGVWFNGRYSGRFSGLGGFIITSFDGLDFSLPVTATDAEGNSFGFDIAGTLILPTDIYDYGDDILGSSGITNKIEVRSVFGSVLTTGSISTFRATVVPAPSMPLIATIAGCFASRRRRRRIDEGNL